MLSYAFLPGRQRERRNVISHLHLGTKFALGCRVGYFQYMDRRIPVPRFHLLLALSLVALLWPAPADAAWSKSSLQSVAVSVSVVREGASYVETQAQFHVEGGRFRGFDLAALPGAELVPDSCEARVVGGLRQHVKTSSRPDGSARIVLADKAYVSAGTVVFTLVHRIDFVATGALRRYAGRARLDWTPIVWDQGMKSMSVALRLPGESRDAAIVAEKDVVADYDTTHKSLHEMSFLKHRAPRWYPMRVLVDFDAALVSLPARDASGEVPLGEDGAPEMAGVSQAVPAPLPNHWWPTLIALVGFGLLLLRSAQVRRVFRSMGLSARFRWLPRTPMPMRLLLSLLALALGIYAGWRDVMAGSVPAFFAAILLWIPARTSVGARSGHAGAWRKMSAADVHAFGLWVRTYEKQRASWLDAATVRGALCLGAVLLSLGVWVWHCHGDCRQDMLRIAVSGALWVVPIWFSFHRSELPVDPAVESFRALRAWRRSVVRTTAKTCPEGEASWWVREDETGPVEVRLKMQPPPSSLSGLDVAAEVVLSGSTFRMRKAFVLRRTPGTALVDELVHCPGIVERHRTADCQEEIVVLRDRRGRWDAGLKVLRAALTMI